MNLLTRIAIVASFLASPALVLADYEPWAGTSVLSDPVWQKRFLGSYGFLSGAEPELQPGELETLREVIDVMKINPLAASQMLEAQRTDGSSAALDFILANLYFQNGEEASATAAYEKALQKFPDFRRAHKNLGLLRVQQGDFRNASLALAKAIELGDRDGRNFGLLGYTYLNLGHPVAAEQAYRSAILQQPEVRDWQLGLARSLLSIEKHEEAAALFATLIERDPSDTQVWLLQANAFIALERPLDAAVNLEAVRLLGKASTSSLVLLGDIYLNERMAQHAASVYREAIEQDEGSTQFKAASRAVDLLIRTEANAEATALLAALEAQYADRLTSEQELEVMTLQARNARAQGQARQAAEMLESIVARDGTRGDALLELAAYHRETGDEQRALLFIERAQRLEAFEYRALLVHAQMKAGSRDYERAAALLKEALEIRSEVRVERFLTQVENAIRRS